MTWLLRVLFICLPMMAGAEIPQVPQRAVMDGFGLEVTLTPGLGLEREVGRLIFRSASKTASGTREHTAPLMLDRAERVGNTTTYLFKVPESAWPQVMAFWDHHDVPSFQPALFLCRNPEAGTQDRLVYSLHRSGHIGTPTREIDPAGLRKLVMNLRPCPATPTAR